MKKDITISHLVANGCSFTYGDGLDSPTTQAWPKLLADKLGVPVVNLALGGASNDRIYRKTVDYFFADNISNPFYVIGMTSNTRREEYRNSWKDYAALNLAGPPQFSNWNTKIEQMLAEESDDIELIKRKLNIWLAIINLFKSTQTNYFVFDTIPDDGITMHEVASLHPRLYEYVIGDSCHLSGYFHFVNPLPKLPCGHQDASAQIEIADYLYNNLIDRYNVTIEPNHEYLRAKDFYTVYETNWAKRLNRSDWII